MSEKDNDLNDWMRSLVPGTKNAAAAIEGTPKPEPKPARGPRILVVDDEPDIRASLTMLLTANGFEVDTAPDGRAALDRLAGETYDLLLLDLMMPVLDGYGVLRELAPDVQERLPVVILTAKGQNEDVMEGYTRGATYYVTKPYQNAEVLRVIRYLLKGHRSEPG